MNRRYLRSFAHALKYSSPDIMEFPHTLIVEPLRVRRRTVDTHRRKLFTMILLGLLITLGFNRESFAHAIILEAYPALNATITGPDLEIVLKFNSRIDGARSRLTLVLPDKSTRPVPLEKHESPDKLKAKATGLQAGAYVLRWQVLASDGHISRGEIPFKVK